MTGRISVFSIFFVSLFLLPVFAYADCGAGEHPATATDVPIMEAAGITDAAVGVCWNPNSTSVGADAGQAKADLQNMRCSSGVNTTQLDDKFSTCADKFLKELRQVDGSACINSAFRNEQEQANACRSICGNAGGCPGLCAPPGQSYHQKGLAIDMKSSVSNQQLWQIAAQSGLINPSGLHSSDPRHIQSGGGTDCAGVSVPRGDQGDYYNDTNKYFQAQPSLPFDQQARQALGMQPPPPPPPPAPAPAPAATTPAATAATPAAALPAQPVAPSTDTLNTTPYPAGTCAPQTRCVQDDGNIYYRATTCVDQIYKKCPSGCTGLICNATSTTSDTNPFLSDFFSTSTSDQNSGGNGTSTFDLIDFFAQGGATPSVAIGTATPIDINEAIQDTGNAEVLGGVAPTATDSLSAASGTSGLSPSETFTSGDLSNSPSSYVAQQSSTFQILAQMKVVLTAILPYVTPFGGRVGAIQNAYLE